MRTLEYDTADSQPACMSLYMTGKRITNQQKHKQRQGRVEKEGIQQMKYYIEDIN